MIMVVIKGMMGALFMENKRLSIRLICDLLFMIFVILVNFYFFKIFILINNKKRHNAKAY